VKIQKPAATLIEAFCRFIYACLLSFSPSRDPVPSMSIYRKINLLKRSLDISYEIFSVAARGNVLLIFDLFQKLGTDVH
jgi:hypothetical protein